MALQRQLVQAGLCSVAMNLRGCSGEVNRLARTYHSGVSDDLNEVYTKLSARHPGYKIAVVGYSLGGNVLLKWLGETAAAANLQQPVKAVAVSTPFCLEACSHYLLSGFSRIYGRYFTRRLMQALQNKKQHFRATGNLAELEKLRMLGDASSIRTVWEFDDRVTAPLHGFLNAGDYYRQCSSMRFLKDIKIPALLIQSRDDPMIPPEALPQPRQLSASIEFELQRKGGHVGFIAGGGKPWLEARIVHYILDQL